jgi:hypothetical protein
LVTEEETKTAKMSSGRSNEARKQQSELIKDTICDDDEPNEIPLVEVAQAVLEKVVEFLTTMAVIKKSM